MDFAGKKVTLIGLGTRTHVSLARYLVAKNARVTISDVKTAEQLDEEIGLLKDLPVRLSLDGHRDEDVLSADVIFVTPGAPRDLPCLVRAKAQGIAISSEIELLFDLCPAPIVGITGSSGKTTTTTLVGEILKADNRKAIVGGNIGTPLIDRLAEMNQDSWVVLELSSFQLEFLAKSPRIAGVLNVTPNHLDRHGTFENYLEAKKNILRFQGPGDDAILNLDDDASSSLAADTRGRTLLFSRISEVREGAFMRGNNITVRFAGVERPVCSRRELKLLGEHNLENALAASALATAAGVQPGVINQVLTGFTGVEHRLELVREIDGVAFYNDSIATSPERALAGLLAFDRPIVLIAGNKSKHLPLDKLAATIVERVRHLVLMGELGREIDSALRSLGRVALPPVDFCDTFDEAISRAASVAHRGDVVLLSPGGTSFDLFRDFEERGRQFKALVSSLPGR